MTHSEMFINFVRFWWFVELPSIHLLIRHIFRPNLSQLIHKWFTIVNLSVVEVCDSNFKSQIPLHFQSNFYLVYAFPTSQNFVLVMEIVIILTFVTLLGIPVFYLFRQYKNEC